MWFGGGGFASGSLDLVVSIALVLVCATYLYIAIGAVYGARSASRVLEVVALTVGTSIVLGYRFALLLVTLYST